MTKVEAIKLNTMTTDSIKSNGNSCKKELKSSNGKAPNETPCTKPAYKLSNQRWLILIALCVFGFCNGINNDYVSILQVFTELMQLSVDKYVYISQIFFYIPPLVAMPVAYLLDKYDLKRTMYVCVGLIAVRNFARVLLFAPNFGPPELWHAMRFVYWIVANVAMNVVVVLYYCLPLKVSEDWFPKEERSLAWTCIGLTPILGTALSALTVPHWVPHKSQVNRLAYMQMVTFFISAFAIIAGITRSRPETGPPSERKAISAHLSPSDENGAKQLSMWTKLRRLASNKDIWLHMFAIQTFESIMGSINTVAQDLLKSAGLSIVFAGQLMALMNILQISFQLISSAFLERRISQKRSPNDLENAPATETNGASIVGTCKRSLALQCAAFLLYTTSLNAHLLRPEVADPQVPWLVKALVKYQWLLLIVFSTIYVFARSWAAPRYNEQSARMIAGSVTEATFSAAGTVASCATQTLFSSAFVTLSYDRSDPDHPGHKHHEYWPSILFVSVCAISSTLAYVLFFDGKQSERDEPATTTTTTITEQNNKASKD